MIVWCGGTTIVFTPSELTISTETMSSMEWTMNTISMIVAVLALLIAIGLCIWAAIQARTVNGIQWWLSRQVGYVNRQVHVKNSSGERGPRGRRGEIGDTGFAGPPGTPGRDALPSWAIIAAINGQQTLTPIDAQGFDIIDFSVASILVTGSGITYVPLQNAFLCSSPGVFLFTWYMNPTIIITSNVRTGIVLNNANPPPATYAVQQPAPSDQLSGQAYVTMSDGDTAQLFVQNVSFLEYDPSFGNFGTLAITLNAQRIPGAVPI